MKCSVCKQEFNLLNDLADHNESNETCKNNINIQNMNSDRTKKLIKNRNFDRLNNYYIDEDFEEDAGIYWRFSGHRIPQSRTVGTHAVLLRKLSEKRY